MRVIVGWRIMFIGKMMRYRGFLRNFWGGVKGWVERLDIGYNGNNGVSDFRFYGLGKRKDGIFIV